MEHLKRWIGLLLLPFLLSCGVSRPFVRIVTENGPPPPTSELQFIEGGFNAPSGEVISFDALKSKPLVLIFASDTCDICLKETRLLINHLEGDKVPAQIGLITLLLGATRQDAIDWQTANEVPWTVAPEGDLSLYRKYCSKGTVPCLVVQTPSSGIVLTHSGELSVEEIVKLTGPWEEK